MGCQAVRDSHDGPRGCPQLPEWPVGLSAIAPMGCGAVCNSPNGLRGYL